MTTRATAKLSGFGVVAELVDARRVLELYPAGRVTQSRKLMQVRILLSPLSVQIRQVGKTTGGY